MGELTGIFEMENGNMMLRKSVRDEIIRILSGTYREGEGNAQYHAMKYVRSKAGDGMSLKEIDTLVKSIKSIKSAEPPTSDEAEWWWQRVLSTQDRAEILAAERNCDGSPSIGFVVAMHKKHVRDKKA